MKVKEFIDGFNRMHFVGVSAPDDIVKYIKKQLSIKDYLPFTEKKSLCVNVLNSCTTVVDGYTHSDSVERYFVFTMAMIRAYTSLELSDELQDDYDMLCQNGLLNFILDAIGAEYASCNNLLNMMMNDIVEDNSHYAIERLIKVLSVQS